MKQSNLQMMTNSVSKESDEFKRLQQYIGNANDMVYVCKMLLAALHSAVAELTRAFVGHQPEDQKSLIQPKKVHAHFGHLLSLLLLSIGLSSVAAKQ